MSRRATPATLLRLLASVAAAIDSQDARRAALQFGKALTSADAASLRPILPAQGKVRMTLDRLGPEQGAFRAGQVEALWGDFLSRGSVSAFEIVRIDHEETLSLVHARAQVVDRQGRPGSVGVHLALQPENGRWVLREIRELAP